MMKKPTNKTTQRRRLVLGRETIAVLTPLQLGRVVAGLEEGDDDGDCSYLNTCDPTQNGG